MKIKEKTLTNVGKGKKHMLKQAKLIAGKVLVKIQWQLGKLWVKNTLKPLGITRSNMTFFCRNPSK